MLLLVFFNSKGIKTLLCGERNRVKIEDSWSSTKRKNSLPVNLRDHV